MFERLRGRLTFEDFKDTADIGLTTWFGAQLTFSIATMDPGLMAASAGQYLAKHLIFAGVEGRLNHNE